MGRQYLEAIFDADRAMRRAEHAFFDEGKEKHRVTALLEAVDAASQMADREEAVLRLERLADLCAQVPGPVMASAMIQILNDDEPSVRVAAGEALLDVGYERYAEVARAIERALDNVLRGPAMAELPHLLVEIGEPSALPLIQRFLTHPDPDVIAASIEALSELGDPEAVELLKPLCADTRSVVLDGFEEETRTTIGQLAEEALQLFEE